MTMPPLETLAMKAVAGAGGGGGERAGGGHGGKSTVFR